MKKIALLFAIFACGSTSIQGDEPAQAFLDALRENGYYDVAIDYLTELQNGDLVSADFKRILPFEKAETLIASATLIGDPVLREARLDEAQRLLADYAKTNTSLDISARTLRVQGNSLYLRSRIYIKQSESDRLTASEKGELHEKARKMLEASLAAFREAKSQIGRLVDPASPDAILIDPADPSTRNARDRFRKTYTDVTVQIPMVIEQLADTYDVGDPARNVLLQDGVTEYKKIWDAYHQNPREFPAGVQACIYAARCNQKLGDHKAALDLLAEVFDLGLLKNSSPLSQRAFVLAADSWNKTSPYPHNEVVLRLEPVVNKLNRIEIRQPNWLRVQLELAIAKHAKAAEVNRTPGARSAADAKVMDRDAAQVLRRVARVSSPYRDRARELLSEWNIPVKEVTEVSEKAPEGFGDAREAARDLVVELESLVNEASELRKQIRTAQDDQHRTSLEEQQSELATQIKQLSNRSLAMLDLAIQLVDETTTRRDINDVRFLQCYCFFAAQQYYESALIGEFLLAKYPTIDGTRSAMSMMIQSYSIMLDRAAEEDRGFERNKLTEACKAVVDRWPGSGEAGLAASTMTRLMLAEDNFLEAEKYFLKIPADASNRPGLGLRVGRRLWFEYREKHRKRNADPEAMATLRRNAARYLKQGIDKVTLDTLTYESALSALLLVEALLEDGNLDEAIKQLEGAEIAPLDLVKQKHTVVTQTAKAAEFGRATYKTAIKVYLAAMKKGTDRQAWVDKANGVITAMRQEMEASQDPSDRARVTAIYQLIALELKASFASITEPEEQKKFANTLASFLGSIEKDSHDAKTVLWAGATLLDMADALSRNGLDSDARSLFQQAVSALNRAEEIGFKGDPKQAQRETELKRQRALALRGGGEFKAANEQFLEILAKSPKALNVQVDAAENLQMWAKATHRSEGYREAIKGAGPQTDPKTQRKKNRIWGWEKIMMATRRNDRYRDSYYLALARIIECRMEYGILMENQDAIVSAGNEIANERKRDPNFSGSQKWKSSFEALEKRVNAARK